MFSWPRGSTWKAEGLGKGFRVTSGEHLSRLAPPVRGGGVLDTERRMVQKGSTSKKRECSFLDNRVNVLGVGNQCTGLCAGLSKGIGTRNKYSWAVRDKRVKFREKREG
jgi:hypothetical protein